MDIQLGETNEEKAEKLASILEGLLDDTKDVAQVGGIIEEEQKMESRLRIKREALKCDLKSVK